MAEQQQYIDSMRANIATKTGRTVEEWVKHLAETGLEKHGQMVKHLKSEHALTHGYANFIALSTKGELKAPTSADTDIIDAQYAKKPHLKPIYDAIMTQVNQFGEDATPAPKKAYVSLRRKKQFAILQPSTKTRFDVGLNLKGVASTERLEAAGSWNSMCSHRVRLADVGQVDDELIGWLRQAYDMAG